MLTQHTVQVGDLVLASLEDEINIMGLATCVSFISIDNFHHKMLATHFLCPRLIDESTHTKMSFVIPGLEIAIEQFEVFANTNMLRCRNYLIGGMTKEFSQIGGNIGDLNVEVARMVLSKRQIEAEEIVGGKESKTVNIKDGILSVHFA